VRVVIAGGPRVGKTTLADKLGGRVMHTDDLIGEADWSECSRIVADEWMTEPGPWVIEGTATVRALRKFMALHPGAKPCDRVIWLSKPWIALTPGQARMGKGCAKIWLEIRDRLAALGVEIALQ